MTEASTRRAMPGSRELGKVSMRHFLALPATGTVSGGLGSPATWYLTVPCFDTLEGWTGSELKGREYISSMAAARARVLCELGSTYRIVPRTNRNGQSAPGGNGLRTCLDRAGRNAELRLRTLAQHRTFRSTRQSACGGRWAEPCGQGRLGGCSSWILGNGRPPDVAAEPLHPRDHPLARGANRR